MTNETDKSSHRAVDMSAAEFREAGHLLINRIAVFLESLPTRPVARSESARAVRELIGQGGVPTTGTPAATLLEEIAPLLFDHSLHNGHPRFLGYITSSAAPLGALADLLAAVVNPNVVMWDLAPVASEIEAQTIRWLAELVGFTTDCGGLMVSGGNMANLLGFITARRAKAPWNIREAGTYGDPRRLTIYCSRETHTWVQKAADVAGLGTAAIRWIGTDAQQRMNVANLGRQIEQDLAAGHLPFLVIGTAGNVSTGAIDPLPAIHDVAREYGLWFHVDGAYGAPAAMLPEAASDLIGLASADSVALDPHKWLYSPLEAACVLVRDRSHLLDAFSYRPAYYQLDRDHDEPGNDYYEHGMQNSRGFRALKVWLGLRHLGREGYCQLIRGNMALAAQLFREAEAHEEIEACTQNLSITTFRYVPRDLQRRVGAVDHYLNGLNMALLAKLKVGGDVYVSNAIVDGKYLLRACIVNFRTTRSDVVAVPELVARMGRDLDAEMRPAELRY